MLLCVAFLRKHGSAVHGPALWNEYYGILCLMVVPIYPTDLMWPSPNYFWPFVELEFCTRWTETNCTCNLTRVVL